ncbi:TIGR04222 domain-containing membrane protein [Asanoa sp. NPDC049573]|uniref:TIGR04222 domain-containing membrane protein n=1 Tax=Asanoa sp. NPDC049573 TaxID=3155396 RepID=UPI00341A8254
MTLAAPGDTWGISGPSFLGLYVALALAAIVATAIVRSLLARGHTGPGPRLTPDQVAFLNGGPQLTTYAALGGLRRAGAIGANPDRTLVPTGPLPAGSTALDTAVYNAAGKRLRTRDLTGDPWVSSTLDDIRAGLERAGLLLSRGQRGQSRLAALLLLPVIVLGGARISAGMANERPVGFLTVLVLVTVVWMLLSLARAKTRTRAGTSALASLRTENQHLSPGQSPSYATYGAGAAAMGIALFGASTLYMVDPAFAAEAEINRAVTGSGSSSGGSSCGSGSSCGGGSSCSGGSSCGGGGGCGGGGCGG